MGIKNLNSFIRLNCPKSIKCISVSELSGKKIAIDISIYLYKYEGDGTLIENMYLMMAIMRFYNIIPIFIFDGKPPTEKKELLQKRKEDKITAETEYNILKGKLDISSNLDEVDKQEIILNMDMLKRKFVYITKEKINMVKELIRAFGITYYDAPGEADELCAMLVLKKKVWACMSEDMDMFVYGCTRVLRYFSLLNHTCVLYNTNEIMEELGITQVDFREICVLSGTDYNINININSNNNDSNEPILNKTLKIFKKYHKNKDLCGFYKWLQKDSRYMKYVKDFELLKNIYNIFDISTNYSNSKLIVFDKIKIENSQILSHQMQPILEEDGFLFPPK